MKNLKRQVQVQYYNQIDNFNFRTKNEFSSKDSQKKI